jgi:hypothetical protein
MLPGTILRTSRHFSRSAPAIAGADAVSKPVVIFGHGNGEVIDYWITPFHGFRERGTPEPPRQQRPHARLEQSEPKSALLSFVKS